jgi:hypothetical protein
MRAARSQEDALRDAAHDAFMAFWRAGEADEALWLAYCSAQVRYDSYLLALGADPPMPAANCHRHVLPRHTPT